MVSKTPFPVEVLHHIFNSDISPRDLSHLSRVNTVFHSVAVRILYHTINLYPQAERLGRFEEWGRIQSFASHVSCLKTLCQSDYLASLVRALFISWNFWHPTSNLFRLLNRALRNLGGLTSFRIASPFGNLIRAPFNYIFDGCRFSLTQFGIISLLCHPSVVDFLETQSNITSLSFLSTYYPSLALHPHSLRCLNNLAVGRMELPNLTSLIGGRPVKSFEFAISAIDTTQLNSLRLSTGPIRTVKITVAGFSIIQLDNLLDKLADALPGITSLSILTPCSHEKVG
jgi:hypothetical protein